MEQQAEYDADFLMGYTAYIDGEPMTEGNGTPAWRDGWREAKQEITRQRVGEDVDRQDEELADFDIGFQARLDNQPCDLSQTSAWQHGWNSADREWTADKPCH